MRLFRIALFASVAVCSVSAAWAQYGLYGAPEPLRVPQPNVAPSYAAPTYAAPSYAAPSYAAPSPPRPAIRTPIIPARRLIPARRRRWCSRRPGRRTISPIRPIRPIRRRNTATRPSRRQRPCTSRTSPARNTGIRVPTAGRRCR